MSASVACDNFQTVLLPDITFLKPEVHIMPHGWHQKVMIILATF